MVVVRKLGGGKEFFLGFLLILNKMIYILFDCFVANLRLAIHPGVLSRQRVKSNSELFVELLCDMQHVDDPLFQ